MTAAELSRIAKSQANWLESRNGVRFLDVGAGFLFLWPPCPAESDRCAIGFSPRSRRYWKWLGDAHGAPARIPLSRAVRTAESLAESEYAALTLKDDPARHRRVLDEDLIFRARRVDVSAVDGMYVGQLEDSISRAQADDVLPELGRDRAFSDGLPETSPAVSRRPQRRGIRRDDLEAGLDIPEVDLPSGPSVPWLIAAGVLLAAMMLGGWRLGWRWAPSAILAAAVAALAYVWRRQLRDTQAEAIKRVSGADMALLSDIAGLTGDSDTGEGQNTGALTVKARERLLRRELSAFIAGRPFYISRRGPLHAVVVSDRTVPHKQYAVLSVITLGLWIPVWIFMIWFSRNRQWMVLVDRDGAARHVPID